ncbi:pentapeptide repeat-containing protein [Kutzneria buriramensis]|uniref:Pentapeptide repeat protein n=1 Tax=Kutzneria buriramensis TaxID=1045776 RepID=A0A3E0GW50_9PSEU|nr:pentapeptide repeat-containing protein [Kutzneria buriramensis]REH30707.1 pentapeptide repeat protein [Kutzneria buriramensis]
MVAAAVVVVVVVAWVATTELWNVASAPKDPAAAAKVDAIKTGLSTAAGAGGVFALLLAVRRQWHQELTAADVTIDATARRITELYTKAADQLGSDKAPVRLAGLYALERLAQVNPSQRTTIVQVMCAYLRMPYTPPGTTPEPGNTTEQRHEYRDLVQEREVRLTAQRILAEHLRPGYDFDHPATTFWPNTALDLTGATLIDFDLSGCHLTVGVFTRARFVGVTNFGYAEFASDAMFGGARFVGEGRFGGAKFRWTTDFAEAEFAGDAQFDRAEFDVNAGFSRAAFCGEAGFSGARFTGYTEFVEAEFTTNAGFSSAEFAGDAWFGGARFCGGIQFDGAEFAEDVRSTKMNSLRATRFEGATFGGDAWFNGAKFAGAARLLRTRSSARSGINTIAPDQDPLDGPAQGWARVDVPGLVTRSRVWPAGWMVQPSAGSLPDDHGEGQWGQLVYSQPDASTGTDEPVPATEDDIDPQGTPAPSE